MPKPRTKTGEKNLQALSQIFHVSYDYLIDGKEREEQT